MLPLPRPGVLTTSPLEHRAFPAQNCVTASWQVPPEGSASVTRGQRWRRPERTAMVTGSIAVLSSDGRGSYRCFTTQGKLSYLYANTETKPAQIHFTQLQALKKWTVVETFADPTWRSFFLFLYIDINYITTTRETRNSSFFLYMMNVSNRIKVRKVTQTTGAYIKALPT